MKRNGADQQYARGQWGLSIEYFFRSGRDRRVSDRNAGLCRPARAPIVIHYRVTAGREACRGGSHGRGVSSANVPGGERLMARRASNRDCGRRMEGELALTDIDGTASEARRRPIVYTGFEWRGSAELGTAACAKCMAVSEAGNRHRGTLVRSRSRRGGRVRVAVREERHCADYCYYFYINFVFPAVGARPAYRTSGRCDHCRHGIRAKTWLPPRRRHSCPSAMVHGCRRCTRCPYTRFAREFKVAGGPRRDCAAVVAGGVGAVE